MTRYLVRFGYDGRPFAGWARQPGFRTVEGEILRGIVRTGVSPSAPAARLEVASRTDRGVHARGNALALSSRRSGPSVLRALNAIAPEIVFLEAAEVPDDFAVRAAEAREYRYFVPPEWSGVDRWESWFRRIAGAPIDARSFARGVPAGTPCWRQIGRVELVSSPAGRVLAVEARSFLWGMVRKIVGALRAVGESRLTPVAFSAALDGQRRLTLPLAPADPLVLWEVRYPIRFEWRADRWGRGQQAYFEEQRDEAQVRAEILENLGLPVRPAEPKAGAPP